MYNDYLFCTRCFSRYWLTVLHKQFYDKTLMLRKQDDCFSSALMKIPKYMKLALYDIIIDYNTIY